MWNSARTIVSMLNATISGLEVIGGLSRQTERPKEALGMIAAVVTSLIEGYQGKIAARDLDNALIMLRADITANEGVPTAAILDKFRSAL